VPVVYTPANYVVGTHYILSSTILQVFLPPAEFQRSPCLAAHHRYIQRRIGPLGGGGDNPGLLREYGRPAGDEIDSHIF